MMNFLKSLGLGLVIIILLPLLLLGIVFVGIIMIVEWVILLFKGVIRFFKGDSFFEPLPEDITVAEIKARELQQKTNPNPAPQPAQQPNSQNIFVANYYQYPGQGYPQQQMPQNNPYLNQQQMPQNNPYLNQQPNGNQISGDNNQYIDNNYQGIEQRDAQNNAIEMKIIDEKGGIEE